MTATRVETIVEIHSRLRSREWTLAVAESVTGGQVISSLLDVAGASVTIRGGVVAYATDLKASLLGVPHDLIAQRGPVDGEVASAMASGACSALGADVGLATTGVAGPDTQDGVSVGTVFVACHFIQDGSCEVRRCQFDGDRATVRASASEAALALVAERLRGS